MSIGVIATIKLQPGKGPEFETVFKALQAEVKANEPDTKLYEFFKSQSDPDTYVVMEIYTSKAALDAHMQSAYFKAAGPKMMPLLGGAPKLEMLEHIA